MSESPNEAKQDCFCPAVQHCVKNFEDCSIEMEAYFNYNEGENIKRDIQKIVERQTKFARQAEYQDHDNLVSIVRLNAIIHY